MRTRSIHHSNRSVLVLGAGVSGLTTALCLARRGFHITIVADQVSPGITSNVAGALWEWPPAVCGRHHDDVLLTPSKAWSLTSYERFRKLAEAPAHTGVFLRPANFYFRQPVENNPAEVTKMNELADHVRGFVHSAKLIEDNGVNPDAGVVDAYRFLAPMVDTDRYLSWLHRQAALAGCTLLLRRIFGDLHRQEQQLRQEFAADLIVNCTGLGAYELAGDNDLSPHRGAVIRVDNTGKVIPRITSAHCVANDPSTDHQDMIFIVPRGNDRLLLGGLVEPNEWETNVGLDYAPIRDLLRRNVEFLPMLADAKLDQADPVRVGLRPFRGQSVRLEHEPGTGILHNYGHGGAGVTLSWGCAEHVAQLTSRLLDDPRLSRRGTMGKPDATHQTLKPCQSPPSGKSHNRQARSRSWSRLSCHAEAERPIAELQRRMVTSSYSEAAQWAAQVFDAAADHYDNAALGFWRRFGQRTIERLSLRPGQQVLDLCCGSGESALAAAKVVGPSGRVLAVDAAAPMLKLAAAKARAAGLTNVEFIQADATCTGLPDGLFDTVVCVFGVFFAADMRAFTEEMWRMVAPGGMLAVTTWGAELFEPANREFWDAIKAEDPTLYQKRNLWDEIITPHQLCELLARGGVSEPQAEAVSGYHLLTSPADFWQIVCGCGYRVTVDTLSAEARSRVRDRILDQLRTKKITSIRADVIYGIGCRPPLDTDLTGTARLGATQSRAQLPGPTTRQSWNCAHANSVTF